MEHLFKKTDATEAMWAEFTQDNTGIGDYAVVAFGNSPQMATELARLVMEGTKRATVCSLDEAVSSPVPPALEGYVVLVDGTGRSSCIWQTIELRQGPLGSVDDAFAWDEGEGTRQRDEWLSGHIAYFGRETGSPVDLAFEVLFERFRIVWPQHLADR